MGWKFQTHLFDFELSLLISNLLYFGTYEFEIDFKLLVV